MGSYVYQLKDGRGRALYGFAEAISKAELKRQLRGINFYFIAAQSFDERKLLRKKVDQEALLAFTHRLASLIDSGIPILSAMNILWRQTEDKTLQLVVSHIRHRLEQGSKISEALDDFPSVFPPLYRAMVGIAEKTGGLSTVLRRLVEHLEYQKRFITKIKKAITYPIIVTTFAVIVLIGMFTFIVPIFAEVLTSLNSDLPLFTQVVLKISQFLKSIYGIPVILLAGIALFFLYKRLRNIRKFSIEMDRLKLKIPAIGYVLYSIAISRFTHALNMMLGAGVSIVESFEVAKTTVNNQYIVEGIDIVQRDVEQGVSLYNAFQEAKVFPVMLMEMVGIGESSGTVVKVFENLATHFDEEVDYKLNKFVTIMEPLLIIFVGFIVEDWLVILIF